MDKKLLVISSRLPDFENAHDRRFRHIIESLAREYEVDLLYIQSLFVQDAQRKKIEEKGIRVVSLKELRQNKKGDFSSQLEELIAARGYGSILFSTYFPAKYYLPFIGSSFPGSILIDAGKSQYISELQFAERNKVLSDRVLLRKNAEINRMKEIAVYNNADAVIIEAEEDRLLLQADIPRIAVFAVPSPGDGDPQEDGKIAQEVCGTFASVTKKERAAGCAVDAVVIGAGAADPGVKGIELVQPAVRVPREASSSLVELFNAGLQKASAPAVLIATDDCILPRSALERMLFCLESHPSHGIVAPTSNLSIGDPATTENLAMFISKHYAANFGYWSEARRIPGSCLLVRKELVETAGLLDARFQTLTYALFDLCVKAFQAGYKTLVNNEAFVYYTAAPAEQKEAEERDRKLLYKKWCDAGTDFLELLKQ